MKSCFPHPSLIRNRRRKVHLKCKGLFLRRLVRFILSCHQHQLYGRGIIRLVAPHRCNLKSPRAPFALDRAPFLCVSGSSLSLYSSSYSSVLLQDSSTSHPINNVWE